MSEKLIFAKVHYKIEKYIFYFSYIFDWNSDTISYKFGISVKFYIRICFDPKNLKNRKK